MHAIRRRLGFVLSALGLAAVATLSMGCAIHTQAPIKEVAYDFSDSDFYDRDYAPSPTYRQVEAYDPAHLPAAPLELAEAAFPVETAAPRNDAPAAVDALVGAVDAGARGSSASLLSARIQPPDAD